ncbi:MAG: proton-conducting transporter membrane subunit [Candidatus Omnitrophota bacterium]
MISEFLSQYASLFRVDKLSVFVGIFIGLFSLLTIIYSIGYMGKRKGLLRYYTCIILTFAASLGVVFSNNLILFIVFWGFLGLLLYLLINFGKGKRTSYTAKKAFIIIGGTDALMLLGLALIWHNAGSLQMSEILIPFNTKSAIIAFLCLAAGAFAKAGAMPFHTWVPDTAEDAPVPVTAFLPASLDKLLGIYFLMRICLEMFAMNTGMNTVLMALGSLTIIAAVMMALVQHDLKRLLGYHAVSQVGYMVLGIGTGTLIGIAGGLFHMLNNAIYKSCLFFCAGAVEKKAGTTDLDNLGGLAKVMPVTFITFLIASFSISGVPPFNGFVSKWMIYQGIINTAGEGKWLWIVWLVAAMFGSALTLASFMKLLHAVFLGQPSKKLSGAGWAEKISPWMLLPQVCLAVLCIVFGVWAYKVPLALFILPSLQQAYIYFPGIWNANLASVLLIVGVLIGLMIYLLGTALKTREADAFLGGEGEDEKKHPEMRVSGTEFYNTISDIGFLKKMYKMAEKKSFDIYDVGTRLTFTFSSMLRYIHNGILSSYLSWCLFGMLVLFYFLILR